jgi:hypothetical protein
VALEPTLDAKLGHKPGARTASEADAMLSLAQTAASGTRELIQVQRFNKAH